MNTVKIETVSPAITFLTAARASMPQSIGDRLRSQVMNGFLVGAINAGMVFGRTDGPALKRLSFSTSVGVFDVLGPQHYAQACKIGGTYAAMWESYNFTKAWKAEILLDNRKKGRIAPGIACLLTGEDAEPGLATVDGYQVWWCTSIHDDKIVLGRFRTAYGRERCPGTPDKRLILTRAEWTSIQTSTEEIA